MIGLFKIVPVLMCCAIGMNALAQSPGLQVGSASGFPGATITVPVGFGAGATGVSAIQFDLLFSSMISYGNFTTGAAAAAAGKSASAARVPGGLRVLVYGLNTNAISSGEIATVQFTISSSAALGTIPITITNIVASDPSAAAVPTSGSAGAVQVLTPLDTAAPVISNVTSFSISSSGATISWTTNENADTQVEYGTSTGYGSVAADGKLRQAHSQVLSGLTANTQYNYRVKSKDASGNAAVSGNYIFTTSPIGSAPVISSITISDITSKSATVSWTTNTPSDSVAEYWPVNGSPGKSVLGSFVTQHSLTLSRLQKQIEYHFRVQSTDAAGNRAISDELTFTTAATAKSVTALPRFPSASQATQSGFAASRADSEIMTGMALANPGSNPAEINFTVVDSSGMAISGPNVINPVTRRLDPLAQFSILDMQMFGEGLTNLDSNGWIRMETANPDVAGFFLTFDAGLHMMDGTNLGDVPIRDFAFTEIEPSGSTRIDIANANPTDSAVKFELIGADGTVRSSQSMTVPANGAFVADLYGNLFAGIAPNSGDYVRVNSTGGVLPFELMQKNIGDISSLTGQDVSAGATTLYSPQYVVGGPWKTTLSVLNLDPLPGTVTFGCYGEDGIQIGTTRTVSVAPYGKIRIDDPGFFAQLNPSQISGGYVEIKSDGIRLAGSTVFGDSSDQSFSAALPLIYDSSSSVVFSHVVSNDRYFTGIAMLNPTEVNASVAIELHDSTGALVQSLTESIPARQRSSALLTQYFPSLIGQNPSGYIRVISNVKLVSFALFGTNNLSVLSALPSQDVQ